ncbi:hypothetical protein FYK55_27135 [Roseiconus nitratireducens]|uniref:Uncharacterized protein n=1 Tax=Roseiconus nitratireducens TaxID=2605748 RepID=A0A5M6CZB5_9BACT|nr:hypothetical protein [Roseiconus nitratireducens]KAA5538659.1 hypothetical protein FYK55_27135 [Roseiconus nitratireducens]
MNRILTFSFLALFSPQWLPADGTDKPKSNDATATVLPGKCVFTFPVDEIEREWKWGVSPANHCEYSWMVTVKGGDSTYQFGFSYFNPVARPQSGTFDELLAAGQANVWKLKADGRGASYVDGVAVTCDSEGDALRITIDSDDWVEKLFGQTPKSVKFETSGTQLKAGKIDVDVRYKKETQAASGE